MTRSSQTIPNQALPRIRDPRLDFFRGIAMFIILLAHTPGNPWTLWIPARFGFSDATEIFVFCSGMASALAFGRVFDQHGLPLGSLRIAHRVWQVYWSHIGMFLAVCFVVILLNMSETGTRDYVGQLNLYPFMNNTVPNLVGLMTLTYVPNYFDILPMYLVILMMIPAVMALARISLRAALAAVVLVWLASNVEGIAEAGATWLVPLAQQLDFLHLPAQYWFNPPNDTRSWFFNPFGWQLVFFTGFALMRGWIKPPPVTPVLIALAAAIVILTVPFGWFRIHREIAWIAEWRSDYRFLIGKSDFGLLRYVHFLALAYLGWAAAGPSGSRLSVGRIWTRIVAVIRKVGQQSLAIFVTSMVLARVLGYLLDVYSRTDGVPGKDPVIVALVNLFGFGVIIATAYLVAWIKSQPWRAAASQRSVDSGAETIEGRPA